jgi:hypothetical protein
MSYHEGSNWQAKKEDAGKPLYENSSVNKEKQNNPKPALISIKVMQDDGEYYLIPSVLEDTFNSALKDANFNEEGNDKFIELFSQYRIGSDLSSVELYAADKQNTGATEYATKLIRAEQEIESLTKQLKGHAGVSNENIKLLKQENEKARALLEKFISRHEAGLLPDRFIYNEIKQFLDGTK